MKIADCKKNPLFSLSSQLFLKRRTTQTVNWGKTGSNDVPQSYECCFIGLER